MTHENNGRSAAEVMPPGWGCALTLAIFNSVVMGLLAIPLAVRTYSSWRQDLWYRGGSLTFLSFGGLMPLAILLSGGSRRSAKLVVAITMWMIVALFLWAGGVFNSGGGV